MLSQTWRLVLMSLISSLSCAMACGYQAGQTVDPAEKVGCRYNDGKCAILRGVDADLATDQSQFDVYRELYTAITGQSARQTAVYFASLTALDSAAQTGVVGDTQNRNITMAICDPNSGIIYVDRMLWAERASPTRRELLMLHELGHCVSGLQHDGAMEHIDTLCSAENAHETVCASSRPVTLMHAVLVPDTIYERYKAAYHEELSRRSQSPEGRMRGAVGL